MGKNIMILIVVVLVVIGLGVGFYFLSNSGSSTIPEGAVICTESDGGKDYYTRGTTSYPHGPLGTDKDLCTIRSPGSTEQMPVEECEEGNSCHVIELFCAPQGEKLDFEIYNCPNGCQDGACVQ